MNPRLIAIGGPLGGDAFPLIEGETSVGRDDTNQFALVDSAVSPRHCMFVWHDGHVSVRDLDPGNPSFVNGLPASDEPLRDADQIQIGGSLFELRLAPASGVTPIQPVQVNERPAPALSTIVMHREDVFADGRFHQTVSAERLSRELGALIRISAAISAVRGLAALERPLIELIADVVPAERGAVVLVGHQSADSVPSVGWSRGGAQGESVQVSRSVVERVLREVTGVLVFESPALGIAGGAPTTGAVRSVLSAPLVAFDRVIGAIVLEADGPGPPFDEGHLRLLMAIAGIAGTALEQARQMETLEEANHRLQAELNLDHNMVGTSTPMRDLFRRIARVAPSDSTALIVGESGTGKELVARAIHRNSPRSDEPFVAINCAAITETLLESELFGHERGAFTGAVGLKRGKLEMADGGTVFLDEIGELSQALQAKLLRVLQEREFERVGGTKSIRVDFRLIAATNRDLAAAMAVGAFRRDLFYRLNVVSLSMPPLRDRPGDIPLLADLFARRHASKTKRQISGFSAEALECLAAYDWPGNVRELENAVEHAVVLGSDAVIHRDDLPEIVAEAGSQEPAADAPAATRFHDAIKRAKRDLIVGAVEQSAGNYSAAARILGLHPNYLHRLIRNLELKAVLKDGGHSHIK